MAVLIRSNYWKCRYNPSLGSPTFVHGSHFVTVMRGREMSRELTLNLMGIV